MSVAGRMRARHAARLLVGPLSGEGGHPRTVAGGS